MSTFLFPFIRFFLYLFSIIGLWIVVWPFIDRSIRFTAKKIEYRVKIQSRILGKKSSRFTKHFSLFRHIDRLLYLTNKKYDPGYSTIQFLVRMSLLFLGVFMICMFSINELPNRMVFGNPFVNGIQLEVGGGLSWVFPFIFATLITLIPYFRINYLYSINKIKASYDLLEVVQLFSKFTNLSIDAALDKTASLLSKDNVLRVPVRILSNVFSSYANHDDLKDEIQRFNRVVDTTFAIQFTSDLLYAEREGSHHLRAAVTKLKEEMEQQRISILNVRSNSRDAIQMGAWGNMLVLVLCCGSLAAFLQPDVYLRLQFQTKIGLIFISLILIGLFISFVISFILSKPKLDYF